MNIFIAPIGCTKLQFDNFDSPLSLDYVAKLLPFFERTNYQCLFLVFLEGYILLRLSFASFGRLLDSKKRSPEVFFHRFGISVCWT